MIQPNSKITEWVKLSQDSFFQRRNNKCHYDFDAQWRFLSYSFCFELCTRLTSVEEEHFFLPSRAFLCFEEEDTRVLYDSTCKYEVSGSWVPTENFSRKMSRAMEPNESKWFFRSFSPIRKFRGAPVASITPCFPSIYDQWVTLRYEGNYSSWYLDGRFRESRKFPPKTDLLYLAPREERNRKKRARFRAINSPLCSC